MVRKTEPPQEHGVHESYRVSAGDYLSRAEARLASGRHDDLFYAALELRAGIESRMQEYLEAQRHISKKKKLGWKIAKLGLDIEQAFRLGDKVAEITVREPDSETPIAVLYYTPVTAALRKKGEKLGDYLHAVSFQKSSNKRWWSSFRTLLEQSAEELGEAIKGVLLGPPLMHPSKNRVEMSVSGFSEQEMRYLMSRMGQPKQKINVKVDYLAGVPSGARSRVFMPCNNPQSGWASPVAQWTRHSLFADRPGHGAKLWRYLSFAKLASLLESSHLHFTRVDRFDDHFEGVWPRGDLEYLLSLKGFVIPNFTEQMKRTCVAASCWVGLPHESAAMWRLYAPGAESVAITTTFGKLAAVVEAANEIESVCLAGAGRVQYFDHASAGLIAKLGPDDPLPNTLAPFMLKNISYEHEREVRALVIAPWGRMEIEAGGCDLPIELPDFIDDIVVSPFSRRWFSDAVSGWVERFGFRNKVKPSALSRDVFYMRVRSQPSGSPQPDTTCDPRLPEQALGDLNPSADEE